MTYDPASHISIEERTFYEMRRHHLKMEEIAARQRDALECMVNLMERRGFPIAQEDAE